MRAVHELCDVDPRVNGLVGAAAVTAGVAADIVEAAPGACAIPEVQSEIRPPAGGCSP